MDKWGNIQDKLIHFAEVLEREQMERLKVEKLDCQANIENCKVSIKYGKKYVRVDVGTSGKYMVDEQGNIFGIKGYGVLHSGHKYGTLDTINQYDWGKYTAWKKI